MRTIKKTDVFDVVQKSKTISFFMLTQHVHASEVFLREQLVKCLKELELQGSIREYPDPIKGTPIYTTEGTGREGMEPNVRVKFIGPAYVHSPRPLIGQLGRIVERTGHGASSFDENGKETAFELITVRFDGDKKDTVLDIGRIALVY